GQLAGRRRHHRGPTWRSLSRDATLGHAHATRPPCSSHGTALNRANDGLDRREHLGVGAAAADVPAQVIADLVLGRGGVLAEQALHGHDHAPRAVAALERLVLQERLLDTVQLAVLGQPLDRRDLPVLDVAGQHETGADRLAVEQHRARAAHADATALQGPAQAQIVAQHVEERLVGLDQQLAPLAVDRRGDRLPHASLSWCRRMASSTRSGRIGISLTRAPPSALATALAIAGATAMIADSPMPLAPNGPSGCGVSTSNE